MSITLATTDTIAGISGSSNSITYTITGDEVGTGDTFKVLTQGVLGTVAATIYTVPAATSSIVKTMHLVNTTTSNATASLTLKGMGAGNQILPPITILGGGFSVFGDDGWQTYNSSGQILSAGATGATGATGAAGIGTSGVPAIILSTTAAAGVAATAIATDATIIAFDSTVPVTQAFGDAAATGSAAITARRDHRHGMPLSAFGSNSNDVSSIGAGGASSSNARADHVHRGVHLISSNTSNSLFGDINLQAGTNIALGVTAQTITITSLAAGGSGGSSPAPLTTKGDVYGYSTVAARIPVGTNAQVLTADSTQTLGVKWAAGLAQSYIGYNTIGGTWTAFVALRHYLKKVTLAATTTFISVDAHIRANADAISGIAGVLLTDNAGVPDLLIAAGEQPNITWLLLSKDTVGLPHLGRWFSMPVSATVPAGDYWIGFTSASTALDIANDASGSDVYFTTTGTYVSGSHTAFAKTTGTIKYSIRASVLS